MPIHRSTAAWRSPGGLSPSGPSGCHHMDPRPIRSQHVFCDHCVTGPVVGRRPSNPNLASSSSRLSSAVQSTAWKSSTVSWAKTVRPWCGGSSEVLSQSSRIKLFTAALTPESDGAVEDCLQLPGRRPGIRSLVQQARWMSTDLPSLAISQSRPVAACWAARAALSSPRSRTASSATSSATATIWREPPRQMHHPD